MTQSIACRFQERALVVLLSVLAVAPWMAPPAFAVGTNYWSAEGEKDLSKGKLDGVSLSSDGVLTLAPGVVPIDTTLDLYVWALLAAVDGTLYAGTGDKGRIVALRGGKVETISSGADLEIPALASAGAKLYAGTSPSGLLLSLAPRGGGTARADTLFKSRERYVWAVAPDKDGSIYIGTGGNGKIYRVSPNGKAGVLYDTGDANVTSLLLQDGTLYATTDGRGLVLALDRSGKPRVLYDAPEAELRCLAFDRDGNLYFAANGSASRGSDAPDTKSDSPKGSRSDPDDEGGITVVGDSPGRGGGKIYRRTPDGTVSVFWRLSSGFIHALLVEPDGTLLVGSGNPGGLYRVSKDGESWSRLVERKESPFLALARAGGHLYAGLGNPGAIYELNPAPRDAGTYESDVLDATNVARWGKLRWTYGDDAPKDGVRIRTRTGNTDAADSTWSDWSDPLAAAEGSDIASPPARFLQWKAELRAAGGKPSALRSVRIAYVRRNARPVVRNVDVSAQGDNLYRGESRTGPVTQVLPSGARVEISMPERGGQRPAPEEEVTWARRYRTLKWDADDPDGDPLRYHLYYRGEGESQWKSLDPDVRDRGYTWDTGSVPDGWYRVEVAASDSGGNAPGEALRATATSESFTVDNTPPLVTILGVERASGGVRVRAKAADALSWIRRVQYAVDADDWRYVAPGDGIYDSEVEEVSFTIPDVSPGEHTVAVRALDAAGNVGAAKSVTR